MGRQLVTGSGDEGVKTTTCEDSVFGKTWNLVSFICFSQLGKQNISKRSVRGSGRLRAEGEMGDQYPFDPSPRTAAMESASISRSLPSHSPLQGLGRRSLLGQSSVHTYLCPSVMSKRTQVQITGVTQTTPELLETRSFRDTLHLSPFRLLSTNIPSIGWRIKHIS